GYNAARRPATGSGPAASRPPARRPARAGRASSPGSSGASSSATPTAGRRSCCSPAGEQHERLPAVGVADELAPEDPGDDARPALAGRLAGGLDAAGPEPVAGLRAAL